MDKIKVLYFYLFYKLYKIGKTSSSYNFLSADYIAYIYMGFLEILLFVSCLNYYTFFTGKSVKINIYVVLLLLISAYLNNRALYKRKRWKKYVNEFDLLPKKQNIIGGIYVFIFIVLIIVNLCFSFYLMSLG